MSAFTEAVERNLAGLTAVSTGACPGCAECFGTMAELFGADTDSPTDFERELAEQPSFSWTPCRGCGSTLGGNRHPLHGIGADDEIVHLKVCTDCLFYVANGEEP